LFSRERLHGFDLLERAKHLLHVSEVFFSIAGIHDDERKRSARALVDNQVIDDSAVFKTHGGVLGLSE